VNYHYNLRRSGLTWWQWTRIALRLALKTGVPRLLWLSKKGRIHIIAEGDYWREPVDDGPDGCGYTLAGQCPPHDSIDWQNGGLVECYKLRPFDGRRVLVGDRIGEVWEHLYGDRFTILLDTHELIGAERSEIILL
jgi:hypothetical protein